MPLVRSGSTESHWEGVYSGSDPTSVGWYQSEHEVTLDLIAQSGISSSAKIIDVGSGATTLLDQLISLGFQQITAVDISPAGLAHSQSRLGEKVTWIIDDITKPLKVLSLGQFDLWHDRAVLHFFTSCAEVEGYANTLKSVLRRGGHAIIEIFPNEGAPKCSGLPLQRYDEKMLQALLGPQFHLLKCKKHTHVMPSGDKRPYISCLFKRQ